VTTGYGTEEVFSHSNYTSIGIILTTNKLLQHSEKNYFIQNYFTLISTLAVREDAFLQNSPSKKPTVR